MHHEHQDAAPEQVGLVIDNPLWISGIVDAVHCPGEGGEEVLERPNQQDYRLGRGRPGLLPPPWLSGTWR